MSNKLAFSKRRLEALKAPATSRAYYRDTGCANLQLVVTPNGTKTFYRYGKVAGRPQRIKLGAFPTMTVEQARNACLKVSAAIADGRDPQAERRAARHEQTLGGLWAWWLDSAKGRKRTWREDERMFNAFFKPWANRRLSAIRKTDVQALHAKIGQKNGLYAANRALGLLKAMCGRADAIGYEGGNPCSGIKRFAEHKRDRFLTADEIPVFLKALEEKCSPMLRDFFMVCLWTGARRANVQAMRWEELDFAAGVWRIPSGKAKAGSAIVVPLVAPARAILEDRRESANGNEWVFPTWSKSGHLTEPKRAWKDVCEAAGIGDLRIHDVRRTLGSWLAMTGATLPVIGKLLGHTTPSATQIYARLETAPVLTAAEKAVAAIQAAGKVVDIAAPPAEDDEHEDQIAEEGARHG